MYNQEQYTVEMDNGHGHHFDEDLAAVSLLAEPIRRALYDFVRRQSHAVSRDEAAEAVGIQRSLAAFHLDRLAEAALLAVEFRRLSGRTGPGAGRPAKLYRRSDLAFCRYVRSLHPPEVRIAIVLGETATPATRHFVDW
jgi:DNA-binding transcriptional ArsR family regulator